MNYTTTPTTTNPYVRGLVVIMAFSAAAMLFLSRQQGALTAWSGNTANSVRGTSIVTNHDQSTTTTTNNNKNDQIYGGRTKNDDSDSDDDSEDDDFSPIDPQDEDWPKLKSLIGDRNANIAADVQFMLDFAIIGHPKTATTFTMNWLAAQEEIQMHTHELHSLQMGKPAELVSTLYELEAGHYYKRGYKAPRDIINVKALNSFSKYWPQTKLMVGLRHPVLWFESFYNFRVRHNYKMPPAETLMGRLKEGMYGVSTDEAKFHLHLDLLGKTPRTPTEQKLLSWDRTHRPNVPKLKNPVFLYEINQLHDENQTRADLYLSDLKDFLGLQNDLTPIASSGSSSSKKKEKAIDICDAKYRFVRAELMKNAMEASVWIRNHFLKNPDVTVSSPEHFAEMLETWMVDPCIMR